MGVPASPSGCQPTASAAEEASSRSGIPNAEEFARTIRMTLSAHPNWLPEAFAAVAHGSQLALEALNKRRSASDIACLAALALCDTKRLSPELRASLLGTITKPMHAPNLCELERKFAALAIESAGQQDDAQPDTRQ